jgi:hypothetical protein
MRAQLRASRPAGITRGRSAIRRGYSICVPSNLGTLTSLEEFETAPFPYHGMVPASGRAFLHVGTERHLGQVNFGGQVLLDRMRAFNRGTLRPLPALRAMRR